jgi:hypothetical protein
LSNFHVHHGDSEHGKIGDGGSNGSAGGSAQGNGETRGPRAPESDPRAEAALDQGEQRRQGGATEAKSAPRSLQAISSERAQARRFAHSRREQVDDAKLENSANGREISCYWKTCRGLDLIFCF